MSVEKQSASPGDALSLSALSHLGDSPRREGSPLVIHRGRKIDRWSVERVFRSIAGRKRVSEVVPLCSLECYSCLWNQPLAVRIRDNIIPKTAGKQVVRGTVDAVNSDEGLGRSALMGRV